MKLYHVTVNFNGYIGCDETYSVWADSPEDAIEEARELAMSDLGFEIEEDEDDEDEDE